MQAVIGMLSDGKLQGQAPQATPENLLAFIRTYGRVAPVELSTTFDLNSADVEKMLTEAARTGLVRRVDAGNGYFWELASSPVCDAESGVCTL